MTAKKSELYTQIIAREMPMKINAGTASRQRTREMIKTLHKILFITVTAMFLATQAKAVLYWGRPYDPNLQRWIQRDPIGERGGINLPRFVDNNPVNGVDPYGLDLDFIEPGMGASYPASPTPANWSAPNPSGMGTIWFDSGVTFFFVGGGGAGTQIIRLDNGQVVTYGYVAIGAGAGFGKTPKGGGGGFGCGKVYNVYKPTDYENGFSNFSFAYAGGGISISGQPWFGQNGAASVTGGFSMPGASGTWQWYWIISASDPKTK